VDGAADEIAHRLEMLVVVRWLDAGRPDDGAIDLRLEDALDELELAAGREGLIALMGALGALEGRGALDVAWPAGIASGEARITLSPDLRREARGLVGN
jgi:hypothetical protein